MIDCPFCDLKVVSNQKIFESSVCVVLYNKRDTNLGRCLVVPKKHVGNIRELEETELTDLIKVVRLVSKKLVEYLECDGVNYGFNEGAVAGQMVSHFHFHVLPRYKKDNLPKYHLFHSKEKKDLGSSELSKRVNEFKKLFVN